MSQRGYAIDAGQLGSNQLGPSQLTHSMVFENVDGRTTDAGAIGILFAHPCVYTGKWTYQ